MNTRTNWPAVFAGTFVFLAIETTFGLLAGAIFGAAKDAPSMGAGAGIWTIVLTIIALGCGAKATNHLAGETNALNSMYHGLVMFGLSIFTSILIAVGVAHAMPAATMSVMGFIQANAGWLFLTLLLGGISAGMAGRPVGMQRRVRLEERSDLRPAA